MTSMVFDNGLDLLGGGTGAGDSAWETGSFKWLLLSSGYVPDRSHVFVADLTPGSNELSNAGYVRPVVSTPTRTIDGANHRLNNGCDDPDFGPIAVGESARYMGLYVLVTNDSDSPVVCVVDLGGVPTDGTNFIVTIPSNGVLFDKQP